MSKNGENNDEETWQDEDFLSLSIPADNTGNDSDSPEEDVDEDMDTSTSSEDDPLPPWIEHHDIGLQKAHAATALHNEIVQFVRLMEPMPEEIRQREDLVKRVEELVHRTFDNAQVHVFGSQATGLFLPSSDVDLLVITNEKANDETSQPDRQEDWQKPSGSPLDRFESVLREDWLMELSYLEVIGNTKVPLVKFTHAPTNISVDVCFDQESGPGAAQLMKTYLEALPPLRPLTFVLKYFLSARGLNEPYSGGVGSYLLQLMIVSFLQHRERDAYNYRRPSLNNLGCLLLEFLELYGIGFNYTTTGISVRNDGFYFPKGSSERKEIFWQPSRVFMIGMENPLETTMDVGRSSFRIRVVQGAFAAAYRVLLTYMAVPLQPTSSILASILPPTQEMRQRRFLKRKSKRIANSKASPSNDCVVKRRRMN
jgi:non-canonical poly(A) RNA polymerase PAPD5/7